MQYIVTALEMKNIEKYVIEEVGIPSLVLMERAALSVTECIKKRTVLNEKICIVCGQGNNGADGVTIARQLMEENYKVDVVLLGIEEKFSSELKAQLAVYEKMGGHVFNKIPDKEYDVFVDAIFGIGLTREISDEKVLNAIKTINDSDAYIYSVDIPSGIHTDTGNVMGMAVKANETITFTCEKVGTCIYPGKEYAGKVTIQSIGICEKWMDLYSISHRGFHIKDWKNILKEQPDGNKGTFGKILIVAGNCEISGAALLCAKAAMKCGAGMVKVLSNEKTLDTIRIALPEAMMQSLDNTEKIPEIIKKGIQWADIIICGPGIGKDKDAYLKLESVLQEFPEDKKLVLDADALNLISEYDEFKLLANKVNYVVYTPHMMELQRLTGVEVKNLKSNLDQNMEKIVCNNKGVFVCKDSVTRVYVKDRPVYINRAGNSGMATAGCGDVLAGMIGAFVARKNVDFYDGIVGAVYLHSFAADMAAVQIGKNSLMATDIIDKVATILSIVEDIS